MLLIFVSFLASGQEKMLRFRVVVPDSTSVANINVVNLVNEKSAVTDSNGEFTMLAKADDLLVLQKESLEYKRQLIEPEDLSKSVIIISMIPKPVALKEVVVSKKAERDDLSKTHKDHKKFTPAERHLYTARTGLLDPLLNKISGRTNQLKKEQDVELKERLLARTETIFDENFYVDALKIPSEYITDFQRYMIDNPEFVSALKARNKTLLRFEASKLATSYHELMAQELSKE
ncbi:MAG: hypothetical protein EOO48_05500 [Flavobacterium sp.]|nr:MAG: hypothetical protein EOO48_05500 [Flavobacterium sp.]